MHDGVKHPFDPGLTVTVNFIFYPEGAQYL